MPNHIHVNMNDQSMTCQAASTLSSLLVVLNMPLKGIAIAINDQIIPQSKWETHVLNDEDTIAIFTAIAGG